MDSNNLSHFVDKAGCCVRNGGNPLNSYSNDSSRTKMHAAFRTDIDVLMAQELNQLSLEEREKVFEDIHGVSKTVNEESAFVTRCLELLEEEINKIRKRQAYDRALFLNPKLVKDDKFRLMFLRADNFDPFRAAKKIVNHFKFKLDLFGEELLARTITFDDLDKDDQDAILMSGVHFSPEKDRAGRTLMFFSHEHVYFKHWVNHLRARWYQVMAALEDEQTQQKGIVVVMYGKPHLSYTDLMSKVYMLRDGLPYRWVSIHFCFDDTKLAQFVSLMLTIWGKEYRNRFRPHHGSSMECLYSLKTYGISESTIPLDCDGNFQREVLKQFAAERKEIEAARIVPSDMKEYVDIPNQIDVLLGRGRPFQDFSGNMRLREIIAEHLSEYKVANQTQKTLINKKIVKMIKASRGRFLKRDAKDRWIEVDDATARLKVSHCFRNCSGAENQQTGAETGETPSSKRRKAS